MGTFTVTIETDRYGLIQYLKDRVAEQERCVENCVTIRDRRYHMGQVVGLELAIRAIEAWADTVEAG